MPREPTQAQLSNMSNSKLKRKGYIRIPGFTKADGTKVKSHIRKITPGEKKTWKPLSPKQEVKYLAKKVKLEKEVDTYGKAYVNALNAQISPNLQRTEDITDNLVAKKYGGDLKKVNEVEEKHFMSAGEASKKLRSSLGKLHRVNARLDDRVAKGGKTREHVYDEAYKRIEKHDKLNSLVFGAASARHQKIAREARRDRNAEVKYRIRLKKLVDDYNK